MPPSHNWLLSLLGIYSSSGNPAHAPSRVQSWQPQPRPLVSGASPSRWTMLCPRHAAHHRCTARSPKALWCSRAELAREKALKGTFQRPPHLGMLTWPRSPGPHPSQPVSTCPTSPGPQGRPSSQLPRPGTQLAPLHRCGWDGGGTDQGAPREAWPLPAQPLARASGSLRPVPSQPSRPRP